MERVVLSGQIFSWTNVGAGVPEGSILGPLLFLIYINDLSDNLSTNAKQFAGDISMFSAVHNMTASSCDLKLLPLATWIMIWTKSENWIFNRK